MCCRAKGTTILLRAGMIIEYWLEALARVARGGWAPAHELALCGRLIKGYGDTNARAHENMTRILDTLAKSLQLDEKGRVRGILFRLKREKSGTFTPVFQIGLMSRVKGKVVNTTVSVNRFGLEEAWVRAVDFYCEHKSIVKRSKTYKELLTHQPSKRDLNALVRSGG